MSTLRRPRVPVKKATPAQLRAKSAQLEQLLAQLKDMEDFPEGQRGPECVRDRRDKAQQDFRFFARTYLPELIQGAGCDFHDALAQLLQDLGDGDRVLHQDPGPFGELIHADAEGEAPEGRPDIQVAAVAAPRGHAKSTWCSLAFPLWCLLTGRQGYAVLISDVADQAAAFVEAVRAVLQESPRIRSDFGQIETTGPEGRLDILAPAMPDGSKPKWRVVRLLGLGAKMKLRGRNFHGRRPGLVIQDDVENDEAVESADRRRKLRRWFFKAVIPALAPTKGVLLALGTILHDDSLLMSQLKTFGGPIWRCWDAEERPLWPERFGHAHLAWMRLQMDREEPGSFSQEYENRAQGDEEKPFKKFDTYDCLPDRLSVLTHVDPALGKQRGDYTALVTVGMDNDGCAYVLDAVIKRIGPTDTGRAIIRQREAYPAAMQAEEVAYQAALAEILGLLAAQEGLMIPLRLIRPKGDKISRISAIAPHIETGRIKFPRLSPVAQGNASYRPMVNGGISGMQLLMDQLLSFPKGAHDDGPDALAAAVSGRFQRKPFGGFGIGMSAGGGL